jgi:hypothetical protein
MVIVTITTDVITNAAYLPINVSPLKTIKFILWIESDEWIAVWQLA